MNIVNIIEETLNEQDHIKVPRGSGGFDVWRKSPGNLSPSLVGRIRENDKGTYNTLVGGHDGTVVHADSDAAYAHIVKHGKAGLIWTTHNDEGALHGRKETFTAPKNDNSTFAGRQANSLNGGPGSFGDKVVDHR